MNQAELKPEVKLPENFNGVFMFTNFSDVDFSDKWNNVEYTFPAMKSSPMIIQGESPEACQHIRKKFAKNLAVREYYKSDRFKSLNGQEGLSMYQESELEPYVQRCLNDLPIEQAKTRTIPRDSDKNYKVSKAVNSKANLQEEFKDDMPSID